MIFSAASLDIINVLRKELPEFGCPATTVSALAGISSGKLSSYMNGVNRCPNEHDRRLRETWAALKKLIHHAEPLPIDYRKVDKLRQSLDAFESGALQIVIFTQ
jgi:hypothetical protein